MAGMTKLGKYLIRRELGKGAMGVVYEGFDPVIERTVAIKTILPSQLSGGEMADVMARFKREAQAAGRLNHPGVVAVYDYGEVVAEDDHTMVAAPAQVAGQADTGPRVAFIAMEFVKGRELRDFFEANERFPLKEVERIMLEILDALDHAHSKGVTHRDMKPANLILLADGKVKVADFGIARIETSELTQAGTVMGTPSYMSPEQFMGQTVDGRSDLFSCGVILYQFLTGEKPFTGTTTTIMYKVLREEPLPPSTLNLGLPPAWDAVVNKAIAKNPADRFQSAKEFAQAISAAVAQQGVKQAPAQASAAASADDTYIKPGKTNTPASAESSGGVPRGGHVAAPVVAPSAAPTPHAEPALAARSAMAPAASGAKSLPTGLLVGGVAGLLVVGAAVAFFLSGKQGGEAPLARPVAEAPKAAAPAPAAPAVAAPPVAVAAPAEPAPEPGTLVISALGLADPKDPKFKGDASAAQSEARADASRQLIDKALALYVDRSSLNKNYSVIEQKLLSQSGSFIKSVIHEGAPVSGKDGLIETETRAVIKMRDVQKSLNQLSKEERIDFIRNNGDPKVSITMLIANSDTSQALPPARSVLAENVLKERIKTFGFRVWSVEGEAPTGPKAQVADFAIQGEAKVKQLSMKLQASGLTVSKTVLTSWTIKAIDKSNGEEIYLNTVLPKGQSWASEEQALMDIGKAMGDEFSKNFFLQHFNFGTKRTNLNITGLPDKQTANLLLRELRGIRQVLDVQLTADTGQFQLQLAEGSASDILQERVFKPLNAKLGHSCFALAGSSGTDVSATFAAACAEMAVRSKFESAPPAGLFDAPDSRGKSLLRAAKTT
jgi:eukaryotic-like serine/threonine-protein kinase